MYFSLLEPSIYSEMNRSVAAPPLNAAFVLTSSAYPVAPATACHTAVKSV